MPVKGTITLSLSRPDELLRYVASRSVPNAATGCLEWQRGTSSQGSYPSAFVDGKFEYLHRAVFAIENGELPEGSLAHETDSIEIHHRCQNRRCLRPNHLVA